MRSIWIAILLAVSASPVFAQYEITGRVINDEGQALIGANVYVDLTFRGAITDINGKFIISNLPGGSYVVKASYVGYTTSSDTINMQGNMNLSFLLNSSTVMAEEVIVTAIRAGQNSPVAHTNVSREEIRDRNLGKDIPILLKLTPSMVTTSDAGNGIGYTNFRVRGTDMNRINVTVNGIPLNDSESHGVWWVNMPDFAASVDNIQIQRGVGTSTNGGAAFGATMNFQTFTMNPEPYGTFNTAYGTFNTWRNSLSAGTGILKDKFTLDMRLSMINSDGYIDRAFADLKSFFVSGAYYGEKSLLKLNVFSGKEHTYQAWYGVPLELLDTHRTFNPAGMIISPGGDTTYYDNESDNYQQSHYQLFYSRELGERFIFNGALHYTYGRGYYEQYKQDEDLSDYQIPDVITGSDTITSTDLIRQKWLDNDFYGFTWSLNYKHRRLKAFFGGGWNNYDGRHFGNVIWARMSGETEINHEWYRNKGLKRDWNTYLKMNYQTGKRISLFGDLQYRHIGHNIDGIDDDLSVLSESHIYRFVNPKLGATFDISNQQRFALSVAMGNREPNRSNFVDADPAHPVPTYETMLDYELAYRFTGTRSVLEANLFYMDYHNQLVLTGEINDVGAAIMTNIDDSYRMGIELIAGIIPAGKVNWDLNLTLSRNRIRNFTSYVDNWDFWSDPENEPYQVVSDLGETDLSFSPSVVGGSRISYKPVNGLKISLLSKYVGKQYIDNTSSEAHRLNPYFVNDLQVQFTLKPSFMKEIGLNLMLNNFLNEQYESNAWIYRYYYEGIENRMDGYFPQAGIHFLAGLSLKF
ncbi:MAG: TonB-dependent receptor [Bacteroidales bacterium]|nr:TonB-dependent receptor [Bacteroidales bacterium]